MAGVSFLIRVLPMTIIRKQIKSRFIRSFLFYVPYVTLAVMTFPAIRYLSMRSKAFPKQSVQMMFPSLQDHLRTLPSAAIRTTSDKITEDWKIFISERLPK